MTILIGIYLFSLIGMSIFIRHRNKKFEKQYLSGEIDRDEYESETMPVVYMLVIMPVANTILLFGLVILEPLVSFVFNSHIEHTDRLEAQRNIYIEHNEQKTKILKELDDELDQKLLQAGLSSKC